LIEVQDGVKMLQEHVSEDEIAVIVSIQGVLRDCELAHALALEEIGLRAQLKKGLADQERD
jgi:hypothetical protein